MSECLEEIKNAVIHMENMDITGIVQECLDQGVTPIDIIEKGLNKGLEVVGANFEEGVYFLSELIMGGEIVKGAMNILKGKMKSDVTGNKGKVILATVAGDVHDIGKNIVAMVLSASGYEIVDLGVDVSTETIINNIPKNGPSLLGLSVLLTPMVHSIRDIVNGLEKIGLRDKVKIAIGGACCSQQLADEMGVDAYGETAVSAVHIFDGFRESLGMV
jgi:5-methyltetrahydrofolate--homocysteine methyltransferase